MQNNSNELTNSLSNVQNSERKTTMKHGNKTEWTWPGICTSQQQKDNKCNLRVLLDTDS